MAQCIFGAPPWKSGPGPRDRSDLPLEFTHARGGLYVAEDWNYWKTNQVVYVAPDGVYFFDAGWSYKSARQLVWFGALESLDEFRAVILTSYRLQRSGGLSTFRGEGVSLWMHRRSPSLLRDRWTRMQREMLDDFSSWRVTEQPQADRLLTGGETFAEGRVQAIALPHAYGPDNLAFYFPEERIVYAGSLLAAPPRFLEDANFDGYPEALEILRALDAETYVAGHGEPLQGPELLDQTLSGIEAAREEREARRRLREKLR